jgi:hypothetical protein
MGEEEAPQGKQRTDTVVSVRFTAEEVAQLRQAADAQDVPLSAMIRQTVLQTLGRRPPVAILRSVNQAGSISGWAFYGSPFVKIDAGNTGSPGPQVVSYRVPSAAPGLPHTLPWLRP